MLNIQKVSRVLKQLVDHARSRNYAEGDSSSDVQEIYEHDKEIGRCVAKLSRPFRLPHKKGEKIKFDYDSLQQLLSKLPFDNAGRLMMLAINFYKFSKELGINLSEGKGMSDLIKETREASDERLTSQMFIVRNNILELGAKLDPKTFLMSM